MTFTNSHPLFFIGQLVHHKKFDYRGVIIDVDAEFSGTEEWYQQMAKSRPPKDRPWYHVLVDGAQHTTYVAERNLRTSSNKAQIDHPMLGDYFNRYNGERYFSVEARQ